MTDISQSGLKPPEIGISDFNLIIDSKQPKPGGFQHPQRWDPQTFRVSNLTVHAHLRAPHTPPRTSTGYPIITYHDIGQNASTCFNSFFAYARTTGQCPQIDAAKAHFHLTAPGHEFDESTVGYGVDVSFDALVQDVLTVLDRFDLTTVIAFGVGIGASVFIAAAAKRPKVFKGLILVSPLFYATSMMERLSIKAENVFSKGLGLGLNRHIKERFLWRWLSDETRESNRDVAQTIEETLDRLNSRNVVRFVDTDALRPDITEFVKAIRAKTLILTGKASNLVYHSDDAITLFNPEITTWLNIAESGSLVHDERPEEAAKAVSLFLQGFPGYC